MSLPYKMLVVFLGACVGTFVPAALFVLLLSIFGPTLRASPDIMVRPTVIAAYAFVVVVVAGLAWLLGRRSL